jgi:serine phosphatase RsbU (regulator of sigma subunit)/DNA-binding NarL/FixJ family response regulator
MSWSSCPVTQGKAEAMSNVKPIRVMIVDDHSMVRKGLATILRIRPELQLVGEASDGRQALQLCQQSQPDVILMDMVMPEMDGAAATRTIRERWPQVQVIVLTSFKEKGLVQSALEAGAIGYLLKNVSAEELAEAIQAAHAGRPTLAPEVSQILTQAEKLEELARAIVDAPPDASNLPELLQQHVPGMFPQSQTEIRLFPDRDLLRYPDKSSAISHAMWTWLGTLAEVQVFLPGTATPWGGSLRPDQALIAAPIVTSESPAPVGGLWLIHRQDPSTIIDQLPMVKSLVAQIASALSSAQTYAQTQAHEKMARELAMAGQIQASFLPGSLPDLDGWQVSATLEPANETSGDFYDLIPLQGGQVGLVIADVSDKGIGAALYMALSHTLLRTYAAEHPTRPDLVLGSTSRRILADARAGLFVTAFYGILDPETGRLTYCNAGHNPPVLLRSGHSEAPETLEKTGMALGAVEDTDWQLRVVQLEHGDALILYTDGITDAQNQESQFFGRVHLLDVLRSEKLRAERSDNVAQHLQKALMQQVRGFMGEAPQYDDMTLLILVRDF